MKTGTWILFALLLALGACNSKEQSVEKCAKELYPILRERLDTMYSQDEVMQEARRTCEMELQQAALRKAEMKARDENPPSRRPQHAPGVAYAKEIAAKTMAYYKAHHRLPPSSATTPAEGSCCNGCAPDASLWNRSPWSDIGFKIDDPTYFSVALETSETAFTARATGDLDCDGKFSTFESTGKVGKDGEMQLDAYMYKNKELE